MTTKESWKTVTIGGTTGILMGAGTMYAIQSLASENSVEASTDNTLQVANPTDGLGFRQAFEAARAEVGPGGVFRWHGNIYSTYTEEEWSAMSEQEHDLFAQRVKPEVSAADINTQKVIKEATQVNGGDNHTGEISNEGGEKVVQTPTEDGQPVLQGNDSNKVSVPDGNKGPEATPNDPQPNEEDVRIVGFGHVEVAPGQYVGVGEYDVNGQRVAIIDVDEDGQGDIAMSDLNQNGQADDGEIIDLHTGESLTFTNEQENPYDGEMAQDDSQPVDDESDMLNFTI